MRRLILILVAALAVALVFVLGRALPAPDSSVAGATTVPATATPTVSTDAVTHEPSVHFVMPAQAGGSSCSLALYGHDALVTFQSDSLDVAPACANTIRVEALIGELWGKHVDVGDTPAAVSTVCTLANQNGGATATVQDGGGSFYGQQLCMGMIAAGWVEQ